MYPVLAVVRLLLQDFEKIEERTYPSMGDKADDIRERTVVQRLRKTISQRLHQHILYGEKPPVPYIWEKKFKKTIEGLYYKYIPSMVFLNPDLIIGYNKVSF